MGQIIGSSAKPKRCNLNKLSQFGTPASGEHILVSSDNSMNAAGQGNFDCYIEGNGRDAATALPLHYLNPLYNTTGDAVDGAMTQQAVTRELTELANYSSANEQRINEIISKNLSLCVTDGGISPSGIYSNNIKKYLIPCKGITSIHFVTNDVNRYAFFKSWDFKKNEFEYANGYSGVVLAAANTTFDITTIPADAKYFYIQAAFIYNGDWAENRFRSFTINEYDVLTPNYSKIQSLQNSNTTINQTLTTQDARITSVEDMSNGKQVVPDTSATLVSGQTNNVFIYQSYAFKAGQRIRFYMSGIGDVIENYRWYDASTHIVDKSIYEFVAENDFTLNRVAIISAAIIREGEVTFSASVVGFQDAISNLEQTKADAELEAVSLNTLQDAADVTGNVFEESFSFTIDITHHQKQALVFKCVSKFETTEDYTEGDEPQIQFTNDGFNYCMSNKNDIAIKEWRILPSRNATSINVTITIPAGVKLIVSEFGASNIPNKAVGDLMIYSHGSNNASHFCTMEAWTRAALFGAYGIIAVPKRTSDGVWVAFHDDGNVNGVMMYIDKSSIPNGVTIANSTYADTQTWRFKAAYLSEYDINEDGSVTTNRIPKLEDYFKLCAKTGMRPCLSWHPYPTEMVDGHYRDFVEIKALADKYGLTNSLCIKFGTSGASYLQDLHAVFGDTLDMVLLDASGNKTYAELLAYLQSNGADVFDKTKTKYGIEYSSDMDSASEEVINQLVADGYTVGMCYVTDGKRMDWCLEHGITDYTLDVFHSWGLNW